MLGYINDTTKIWRLWDPIQERVIQASNVRFDESMMEGKRIINEETKDTLRALANSELAEDSQSENIADIVPCLDGDARSSGLVIEVQLVAEVPLRQDMLSNQKPLIVLHPNGYKEALSSDHHEGWKQAIREEFTSVKANDT